MMEAGYMRVQKVNRELVELMVTGRDKDIVVRADITPDDAERAALSILQVLRPLALIPEERA